jgi:predicted site-specific integrase-resolvase
MPAVIDSAVLIIPAFPAFSPAAIAKLLTVNRGTVHYWLEHGKLLAFRDNIGERYVPREELIRFVRDYLKRGVTV